jgi:hypothetical protein
MNTQVVVNTVSYSVIELGDSAASLQPHHDVDVFYEQVNCWFKALTFMSSSLLILLYVRFTPIFHVPPRGTDCLLDGLSLIYCAACYYPLGATTWCRRRDWVCIKRWSVVCQGGRLSRCRLYSLTTRFMLLMSSTSEMNSCPQCSGVLAYAFNMRRERKGACIFIFYFEFEVKVSMLPTIHDDTKMILLLLRGTGDIASQWVKYPRTYKH